MVAAIRRSDTARRLTLDLSEAVAIPRLASPRLASPRTIIVAAWVLTRALLVAAAGSSWYPYHSAVTGDVRLYARWASILLSGHFPLNDPTWQYPPGAAAVIGLPGLTPLRYYPSFIILALIADALVLAVLLRRDTGSNAGAWLWIIGTTALGPIVLNRFDTVPTLLTVAALALVVRPARAPGSGNPRRSLAAGMLLGLGAAVKVWPILLLPVIRRRGHVAAGAVAAGVAILAGLAVAGRLSEGLDFRHNQQARGLQVETVAATPYLLARALGASGIRVVLEYGAYQVHGPGVSAVVTATTIASGLVVLALLALAWRRPGNIGLGLAGLLAVLLTARVLSPQYLVWVLGVAAFTLTNPASRQRLTAGLLIAACALTQWLYPIWYVGLIRGGIGSTLLLAVRNAVLLAAFAVALLAALREHQPAPAKRDRVPAPPAAVRE